MKRILFKVQQVPYRHILIALVGFWLPVIVFARLANGVGRHEPIIFDAALLNWVHTLDSDALTVISKAITAEALGVCMLAVTAWYVYKRQRHNAALLFFGVGGAAAANLILKVIFQRTRPDFWPQVITETSYSFPSGHAMASSAFAACMVIIFWHTKWRWLAVAVAVPLVILIGFSRLYLGVHFPSDVMAGWCVGVAWVLIVFYMLRVRVSYRTAKGGIEVKDE